MWGTEVASGRKVIYGKGNLPSNFSQPWSVVEVWVLSVPGLHIPQHHFTQTTGWFRNYFLLLAFFLPTSYFIYLDCSQIVICIVCTKALAYNHAGSLKGAEESLWLFGGDLLCFWRSFTQKWNILGGQIFWRFSTWCIKQFCTCLRCFCSESRSQWREAETAIALNTRVKREKRFMCINGTIS